MSARISKPDYVEQKIEAYRGNPFIEALPPIKSIDQTLVDIKNYPAIRTDCSGWLTEERTQNVLTGLSFFQPLNMHGLFAHTIDSMLRLGLVPRNLPQKHPEFWKGVDDVQKRMKDNSKLIPSSQILCTSIIGASGIGKSTAVTRILSQYPAIIEHPVERVGDAGRVQIPWLYVECGKTLGGLCRAFFAALDKVFGYDTTDKKSHYFRYAKNKSLDELQNNVGHQAATYRIGVLVLDEMQYLSPVGVGLEDITNFLTRLSNVSKVPLVFIGTYKVLPILTREFRLARRSTGIGSFVWHPMGWGETEAERERGREDWDNFIGALWYFQYLDEKTELTTNLSNALYDETQGITDFAVKLFFLAQVRALIRGEKQITEGLIRQVSRDSVRLVAPALKAFRSKVEGAGSLEQLAQIGDISPLDFEKFYDKEMRRMVKLPSPGEEIILPTPGAEVADAEALQEDPPEKSKKAKSHKADAPPLDKDDLRGLQKEAKESDQSVSDVMLERDIIKSGTEFFE